MVKIITDSTCDMTEERLKALGIEALPLTIHFGAQSFADKVDMDNTAFYAMLRRAEALPTTSQVSPGAFEEVFRRHRAAGDSVMGIFISSKLSGTCQSAALAAQLVGEGEIHVVDSLTATLGLRLLLEAAAALRDAGAPAAEIARQVEALSHRVVIYAVVETLKYLKMGGRLSAASAAVGGFLGICPVIALDGGLVEAVGKGRGKAAALAKMGQLYRQAGRDPAYGIAIGHGDCPQELERVLAALGEDPAPAPVYRSEIGSVIGAHVGPGAAGVAFIRP